MEKGRRERYYEIVLKAIEAAERELSLQERKAAYLLLKEYLFWYSVAREAINRCREVRRHLPGTLELFLPEVEEALEGVEGESV